VIKNLAYLIFGFISCRSSYSFDKEIIETLFGAMPVVAGFAGRSNGKITGTGIIPFSDC
jgi:hypothetical protein